MSGFITLHRKLLDWEWYNDTNTKILFIHCLLKANWEEKKWKGILIERGTFITSFQCLSEETNLSVKQVRLCISKLESTKEIVKKGTNKYTLLTIVKYNEYQCVENERANKRQTKDKQRATTNNIIIKQKEITDIDWDKLLNQFNNITGKKIRKVSDKAKRQFTARIKDGYSKQEILDAIQNCYNNSWHKENPHILTLEFISKEDKFITYATMKSK